MAKPSAWMPLYVGDYIRDTRHLSTAEHGAYLLLIMEAWVKGGALPSDDRLLARVVGMSAKEWALARDVVLEFFTLTGGSYRHGRVDRELSHAATVNAQRSEAGKASAARRWGNERGSGRITSVTTDASRGDAQPQPHSPIGEIDPIGSIDARGALPKQPVGVDGGVWRDFKRQRKKPLTETALAGIQREADKAGWSLDAALRECCARGWQGFKAEWVNGGRNGHGDGLGPSAGAAADWINGARGGGG